MRLVSFIIITSLLFISNAWSATYYVKNGGDDSKDGLSEANAWETLAKCSSIGHGHTLKLNAGDTWTDEALAMGGKSPLTITRYGTGDNPLIDVNGSHDDGIFLFGDNNTVSYIDVTGAVEYGIHGGNIAVPHDNYTITYCDSSSNVKVGIRVNGENSTISYCNTDSNGPGDAPGIQIGSGSNNSVHHNDSSNNSGSGYEMNWDCSYADFYDNTGSNNAAQFLEIWDDSNYCVVERNYGINHNIPLKITKGSSYNIIRNNIFVDDANESGIHIGFSGETEFCFYNKIYNNTIYSTSSDATFGCLSIRASGHKYNEFKNNLIFTTDKPAVYVRDTENTFDYNLYYMVSGDMIDWDSDTYTMAQFATYQSDTGQDANSVAEDPLFGSNYTLNTSSPCISAGIKTLDVQDDFRQGSRRSDYDIGAYAYNSVIKDCLIKDSVIE